MAIVTIKQIAKLCAAATLSLTLVNCAGPSTLGAPNMGPPPQPGAEQIRAREIANEPTGDFFYARRYFVEKTRFWGYLRKPRQPWSESRLVVVNESSILQPDRLPEDGPWNARHGFDNNYEYRITGRYTGRKIYDPASNLFLPEFLANSYTRLETKPGWLFTPKDHYNPNVITLLNKSIVRPR